MFDYHLTESSAEKLVFEFPGPDAQSTAGKVVGWIFLALVVAAIAFALWSAATGDLPRQAHPGTLAAGILALFFSGAAFFGANSPEHHSFTFARDSRLVVLRAKDGSAQIEWPLNDCLDVHTYSTGGSSSTSSTGSSTVWYHLHLRLKDGGRVYLLRTTDAGVRDTAASHLRTLLAESASQPTPRAAAPQLPPSIEVAKGPDGTVLRWRSQVQGASVAALLLVVMSYALLATPLIRWTFFPPTGVPDTTGQVIIGAIVGVLGMLIVVAAVRRLRIHGRRHELRITADGVSYDSRGGLLPARTAWSIARNRLVAVRFVWVAWMLEFLEGNPDEAAAAMQAGRDVPYETKQMVRYGRLTVSQMIGIERFVQAEVERLSGRALG